MSDQVRLDITVIVLAGPDISSWLFDCLSNHIIDEPVFVPDAEFVELGFVLGIVKGLENILESSVIFLKNGILGGHVERIFLLDGIFEAGVSEGFNGRVNVEHHQRNTFSSEVVHIMFGDLSFRGSVDGLKLSGSIDQEVGAVVDISEGMSSDDNGLIPVRDESWDVLDEDGFSENSSVQIVSDGSIGTLPHLLEFEFFDSSLIRGDSGTLDTNFAFLDGFGGVKGDLVVSLVSVLNAQIKVVDVQIQVGVDKLILDLLPEDTSHLVTVKFGNAVLDFDLLPLAEGKDIGGHKAVHREEVLGNHVCISTKSY